MILSFCQAVFRLSERCKLVKDLKNKAVSSVVRQGFALLLAVLLAAGLCLPAGADHDGDTHDYEFVLLQEPDCIGEGIGVYACSCGDMLPADPIPALGHAWDNGTEALAPTAVSEGIMVYACTRCGALQYESIPVLPPAPEDMAETDEPIQMEENLPQPDAVEEQGDNLLQPETGAETAEGSPQPETGLEPVSEDALPEEESPQDLEETFEDQEEEPPQDQQNEESSDPPEEEIMSPDDEENTEEQLSEESLTPDDEEDIEEQPEIQPDLSETLSPDVSLEEEEPDVTEDKADWIVHFPENRPIPYLSNRTEIGTITVENGRDCPDNQILLVQLDYSSFSSEIHSIPIIITAVQNGVEQYWPAGAALPMKLNGSDPITVYINIAEDAWRAAPSGSYALKLNYHALPVE